MQNSCNFKYFFFSLTAMTESVSTDMNSFNVWGDFIKVLSHKTYEQFELLISVFIHVDVCFAGKTNEMTLSHIRW